MNLRSIEFHFVEATNNIRRNGLMAVSAVTNAAACLFVVGAFLLGWWNFARLHEMLSSETRITVFMSNGVPVADAERIGAALADQFPEIIGQFRAISPQDALQRFLLAHPEFPDAGLRNRNPFPASIEIRLANPEQFDSVINAAYQYEEVDEVRAGQEVLRNLAGLRKLGMQIGVVLLALLGGAALLTISNTIRLTIYARRREIDIMQMVGATRSFIRAPFTLEGMFHGIAGAMIGGAVLVIGYTNLRAWIYAGASALQFLQALFSVGAPRELGACWLALITAGCVFGLVGSWMSVARYLHT